MSAHASIVHRANDNDTHRTPRRRCGLCRAGSVGVLARLAAHRDVPGGRPNGRSGGAEGRVTGMMRVRLSRPVKSAGLVVYSGSPSAIAVAAIIRSTTLP